MELRADWAGQRSQSSVRLAAVVLACVALPSQILWAVTGDFILALAPILAVCGLAFIVVAPLRWQALVLLFFFVTFDDIKETPFSHLWQAPTLPISRAVFKNIALIALIDVLLFALCASALVRGTKQMLRPLVRFLWLFILAIVWLTVWGKIRGGDLRMSFYQARVLLWIPGLVTIFYFGICVKRDLPIIAGLLVWGATFKAMLAVYFQKVICAPTGEEAATATTHSDSVLFTSALVLLVILVIELKTPLRWLFLTVCAPIILAGIVSNHRRLAYVNLAGAAITLYATIRHGPVRRWVNRTLFVAAPLGLIYLAIGWNQSGGIWGAAATIAEMVEGSSRDASTGTRDIENYNLVITWKPNLLLGSGWGHEYTEFVVAYSIVEFFSMYRYVAHNGVLWLASISGIVGMSAMLMIFAATVMFATRVCAKLTGGIQRAMAVWSVCIVPIVMNQAFGDMGFHSWHGMVQFSLATAIAAQLIQFDAVDAKP